MSWIPTTILHTLFKYWSLILTRSRFPFSLLCWFCVLWILCDLLFPTRTCRWRHPGLKKISENCFRLFTVKIMLTEKVKILVDLLLIIPLPTIVVYSNFEYWYVLNGGKKSIPLSIDNLCMQFVLLSSPCRTALCTTIFIIFSSTKFSTLNREAPLCSPLMDWNFVLPMSCFSLFLTSWGSSVCNVSISRQYW